MVGRAFCPGNVSCMFYIYRGKKPENTGSLGVGFTVNMGVHATVDSSTKDEIYINGNPLNFATVKTAKELMTDKKLRIDLKAELPFGVGFGMSGASALSTAFAINKHLGLDYNREKLGMIAHKAEVINGTGLGDVAGQLNGGFLIKTKKGNPLYAERLNVMETNVYYKVFSELDTKSVITDKRKAVLINKAGLKYINQVKKMNKGVVGLRDIVAVSRKFAEESKLINDKKVRECLIDLDKHHITASMIMLGNAVFSDQNFIGSKKIEILNRGVQYV